MRGRAPEGTHEVRRAGALDCPDTCSWVVTGRTGAPYAREPLRDLVERLLPGDALERAASLGTEAPHRMQQAIWRLRIGEIAIDLVAQHAAGEGIEKYAPDFPRVAIRQVNLGRITSAEEVERLGLVAAPEASPPPRLTPVRMRARRGVNRRWPSYERCVDGAPLNHEESGPDISKPISSSASWQSPGDGASKRPPRGSSKRARRRSKTASGMPP